MSDSSHVFELTQTSISKYDYEIGTTLQYSKFQPDLIYSSREMAIGIDT